jgi:dCTP deaminase
MEVILGQVMAFLGPEEVRALLTKGLMEPKPTSEKIGRTGWDLTLTLGGQAFRSSSDAIKVLGPKETVVIHPGEFALLLTAETLRMPDDVAGFISVKFTVKQRGLINVSGFHVDPGYQGQLLFSVYNAGPTPVMLQRGQAVFMMCLCHLSSKAPRKTGHTSFDSIPPELANQVMGPPVSVMALAERLKLLEDDLETRLSKRKESREGRKAWFIAIGGGIVGAVAGAAATLAIQWIFNLHP